MASVGGGLKEGAHVVKDFTKGTAVSTAKNTAIWGGIGALAGFALVATPILLSGGLAAGPIVVALFGGSIAAGIGGLLGGGPAFFGNLLFGGRREVIDRSNERTDIRREQELQEAIKQKHAMAQQQAQGNSPLPVSPLKTTAAPNLASIGVSESRAASLTGSSMNEKSGLTHVQRLQQQRGIAQAPELANAAPAGAQRQ